MNFEDRIRQEHDEFRKMLTLLTHTGIEDAGLRLEAYADLIVRVDAHERAEEQTIYEALKEDEELKEMALESFEQHRIGRVLMIELRKVNVDDELWLPKLRSIKGILENHMLFEESLVLPTAKDILGQEAMDRFDMVFEGLEKETLRSMVSGPSVI